MSGVLELAPEPRSVRDARVWIVGQLATIGREDLADAARLGVSELVTNAILHADPPILVRLGGTAVHPRVEVHDNSPTPPRARSMTEKARLLATVGRGLSLVAMYSTTWGADVSVRGKVVWFEPAADHAAPDVTAEHLTGDVFGVTEPVDEPGAVSPQVTVRLPGFPVAVFAHYRSWYDELRRELRLLALSHGTAYPVARELSELTVRAEQENRRTVGFEQIEHAAQAGVDRLDVELRLPVATTVTMGRLRVLLEQMDDYCREQRLLSPVPTSQQVALRSWFLGELEGQGLGEPPRRWTGAYTVEDPDR